MMTQPQTEARPARWWAPLDVDPGPPISAKKAYTHVLLMFAATLGVGVITAVLSLADRLPSNGNPGWSTYLPLTVELLGTTGLTAVAAVLVCRARGISAATLGLDLRRDAQPRLYGADRASVNATIRMVAWAGAALIVGSIVTSTLATGTYTYQSFTSGYLVYATANSLNAGLVEEIVVVAFVVVTLRQARRPWWEVCTVALILRCSYHTYYGVGVVGILVWASVFLWLYVRTRKLLVLMTVHFVWDACAFLAHRFPAVEVIELLLIVGFLIVGPITWLVDRHRAGPSVPAFRDAGGVPTSPPGWYPDPHTRAGLRYWNGVAWTEYTHPGPWSPIAGPHAPLGP